MAIQEDLTNDVASIIRTPWNDRDGQVVPQSKDVALTGGAVRLTSVMLYADLADSTHLVMNYDRRVAAKLFKAYLSCAARLIRTHDGEIRSFDGDRVMGVFLGTRKNSNAANVGLKLNYVVQQVIAPAFSGAYSFIKDGSYKIQQTVGIDVGDVLVVRGGIRDNNDLLWVGNPANVAAKLSSIREHPFATYITPAVFNALADDVKLLGDPPEMAWESRTWTSGAVPTVYRSSWWRKP